MADLGIPQFGVSLCTIPFAEDVDLKDMRPLIQDFTKFKHQYLIDKLDAAFPDYFISQIRKDLESDEFYAAISAKYKELNPESSKDARARKKKKLPEPGTTVHKIQMTYNIQGNEVLLSKNPVLPVSDHTAWLYDDIKPLLLSYGEHLYTQDLTIEYTVSAYVGDENPPTPDEEVAFNFEEKDTIIMKSSTTLGRTIFKEKYNMLNLTQMMEPKADKKFKPEFFKANEAYWGRELYENRTALEQPVFSTYRGYAGCLDEDTSRFEHVCNTTYDETQPENRKGCLSQLSQYGYNYPVEPKYCLNKREVLGDMFYYKTKQKYQCFADVRFHPNPIMIDDEALDCLGLNNDYKTELCLKNYEAEVGDDLTLSNDPDNLYYGRKRKELTEEEKEKKKQEETQL